MEQYKYLFRQMPVPCIKEFHNNLKRRFSELIKKDELSEDEDAEFIIIASVIESIDLFLESEDFLGYEKEDWFFM